jgi:hypothetical protein
MHVRFVKYQCQLERHRKVKERRRLAISCTLSISLTEAEANTLRSDNCKSAGADILQHSFSIFIEREKAGYKIKYFRLVNNSKFRAEKERMKARCDICKVAMLVLHGQGPINYL